MMVVPVWERYYWEKQDYWFYMDLRKTNEELVRIRQKTGAFPDSLKSVLRYDEKTQQLFLRDRAFRSLYQRDWSRIERFRYRIVNGEPVITYLGDDGEEGGLGKDFDVTCPSTYHRPLPFRDFCRTEEFATGLSAACAFAGIASICLFFMWKDRLQKAPTSMWSLITVILSSVVFVFLEFALAGVILCTHIYPHH